MRGRTGELDRHHAQRRGLLQCNPWLGLDDGSFRERPGGSRGLCPDIAGCWVITLTSTTTCAAATPSGPVEGINLQHLTLGTAISERLLAPASAAPNGDSYARVASVDC